MLSRVHNYLALCVWLSHSSKELQNCKGFPKIPYIYGTMFEIQKYINQLITPNITNGKNMCRHNTNVHACTHLNKITNSVRYSNRAVGYFESPWQWLGEWCMNGTQVVIRGGANMPA